MRCSEEVERLARRYSRRIIEQGESAAEGVESEYVPDYQVVDVNKH